MAKNITLMGASYSDVPAVTLPQTGGGTARFDDASVTTATAADVASGKVFLAADGQVTTGTASGGGGASNYVKGTFTGTTTEVAMDVTIPYTGTGYPLAFIIYHADGYNSRVQFYNLVQQYAVVSISGFKRYPDTPSTYSTSSNNQAYFVVTTTYKSSSSSGSNISASTSYSATTTQNKDAMNTAALCVRFKSATKMSVFIASSSYGFAANVEYTYVIEYSS